MICNLCRHLEAPIGKHYCPKCAEAMNHVWPAVEADAQRLAEAQARTLIGLPSLAETSIPYLDATPHHIEIMRVICSRMEHHAASDALLYFPGAHAISNEKLNWVSAWLGCVVERGKDPETLYVTGYESAPRKFLKYELATPVKND